MIKLKKREKLALLKRIIKDYEHYLDCLTINQNKNEYNTGWNNALTEITNRIKEAGILDD